MKLSPKQIVIKYDSEYDIHYRFVMSDTVDELGIIYDCEWSTEIENGNPVAWEKYANFYCKWDGCHNYVAQHNDNCMLHGCSTENYISFLKGMILAYNIAAEHFIACGKTDWRIIK